VRGVLDAHQTSEVAARAHGFVDLIGDEFRLVPFRDVWLDCGVNPRTDFVAEGGMGGVEVGGVVGLVPGWVGEWDERAVGV
jgi:hypothetical protein